MATPYTLFKCTLPILFVSVYVTPILCAYSVQVCVPCILYKCVLPVHCVGEYSLYPVQVFIPCTLRKCLHPVLCVSVCLPYSVKHVLCVRVYYICADVYYKKKKI